MTSDKKLFLLLLAVLRYRSQRFIHLPEVEVDSPPYISIPNIIFQGATYMLENDEIQLENDARVLTTTSSSFQDWQNYQNWLKSQNILVDNVKKVEYIEQLGGDSYTMEGWLVVPVRESLLGTLPRTAPKQLQPALSELAQVARGYVPSGYLYLDERNNYHFAGTWRATDGFDKTSDLQSQQLVVTETFITLWQEIGGSIETADEALRIFYKR